MAEFKDINKFKNMIKNFTQFGGGKACFKI